MEENEAEKQCKLFIIGFCGLDNSVTKAGLEKFYLDKDLQDLKEYIEFGVLFRKELEGTPRFISGDKLNELLPVIRANSKHLAGHLCSQYCLDLLRGDFEVLNVLIKQGFTRFQLNMTKANGVDLTQVYETISKSQVINNLLKAIQNVKAEFIFQFNKETEEVCNLIAHSKPLPKNISILFDSSKGTGKQINEFPDTINSIPCGYAGGIGPSTITNIVEAMSTDINCLKTSAIRPLWIDMESSLRTKNSGTDIFDLEKAKLVLLEIAKLKEEKRFILRSNQ